ncbi:MAG: NUDIX domain-containing protein [Candidatus Dormibacteraeota bacterium]|nr:NUDIX domain-containing protein [Candidatus Dormibacteraeota bacterium]
MTAASPASRDPQLHVADRGAGGVVIRRGADDAVRLVLVHRPRYNDWSFPTGTRRRCETLLGAALREVREQTGFLCLAEASLGVTEYLDRDDRPKLVGYWAMNRVHGAFAPNDEVDAIAWLRPSEAIVRLSHDHDRQLLNRKLEQLAEILEARDRVDDRSMG